MHSRKIKRMFTLYLSKIDRKVSSEDSRETFVFLLALSPKSQPVSRLHIISFCYLNMQNTFTSLLHVPSSNISNVLKSHHHETSLHFFSQKTFHFNRSCTVNKMWILFEHWLSPFLYSCFFLDLKLIKFSVLLQGTQLK